eukprot:354762-Chlamydomonas_euryale.AAC.4
MRYTVRALARGGAVEPSRRTRTGRRHSCKHVCPEAGTHASHAAVNACAPSPPAGLPPANHRTQHEQAYKACSRDPAERGVGLAGGGHHGDWAIAASPGDNEDV